MTDILRCAGLATDPSPLVSAQAGGLRVADDVSIRRPGVAEQRPTFDIEATKDVTRYPRGGIVWNGTPMWTVSNSTVWQVEDDTTLHGGDVSPLDEGASLPQLATARRNLYVTGDSFVRKLTSPAVSDLPKAGLAEAPQTTLALTGSSGFLPASDYVAYRICVVRTDANKYVVRSAPSAWNYIFNSAAGARDVDVTVALPDSVGVGDTIELYRSPTASGIPSDLMSLVQEYGPLTSSEITARTITISDSTLSGEGGRELYTNSTREGILKSNYDPPPCVALASWRGVMWYGNVRNPSRFSMEWLNAIEGTGSTGTNRAAIAFCRPTCSFSSGSQTVSTSSTDNIRVGQLVSEGSPGVAGSYVPINTYVTGVSVGASFTMSNNATATGTGVSVTTHDVIDVDGTEYYADVDYNATHRTFAVLATGSSTGFAGADARVAAKSFARLLNADATELVSYVLLDPNASLSLQPAKLVIRRTVSDTSKVEVETDTFPIGSYRVPVEYEPDTPGDPWTTVDARYPNRAYYSKPDEPEAVPLLNYLRMGDEDAGILAFAPLRDAMLVFKTDGIFRVTGTAPDGWRVDLVDPGTRLLRGTTVAVEGPFAYAWTDRGVMRLDESGLGENLSEGLIGREIEGRARQVMQDPGTTGAYVRSWRAENAVLVGVPPVGNTSTFDELLYVFHTVTNAWSRWMVSTYAAAQDVNTGELYLTLAGEDDGYHVRKSTSHTPGTAWRGYDASHDLDTGGITRDSDTQFTITDAARGDWIPAACDWLAVIRPLEPPVTVWFRVTGATQGSGDYTVTIDGELPAVTGTWTGYEGVPSVVHWQGLSAGSPGRTMQVADVRVLEDLSDYVSSGAPGPGVTRTEIGASTDRVVTPQMVAHTETPAAYPSRTLRVMVDRDLSRCAHFYPRVSTCDVGIPWRLVGVSAEIAPVSTRSGR